MTRRDISLKQRGTHLKKQIMKRTWIFMVAVEIKFQWQLKMLIN